MRKILLSSLIGIIALIVNIGIAEAAPINNIIPYASTTAISAQTICFTGDVCRTTWPTGGGGGSGGGVVASTTSTVPGRLIDYLINNTDIFTVGAQSTSSAKFYFDPNTSRSVLSGLTSLTNASSSELTVTGLTWLTGIGSLGEVAIDSNGKVYSTATTTAGTGLTYSGNSFNVNTSQSISTLSNLTSNGFVKTSGGTGALSIDTNTYLTGNQTITLSGDISGSGATSITTTLPTVNSNVGSFGGTNSIPSFTVNGKGLITAASANTPSIPASEITSGTFGSGTYTFPSTVTIPNASTTNLSGSYASSTNAYFGTLNLPNITGTQCLHSISGIVSGTGSDCGSGSGGSAYPFQLTGNATSTLTQFNGGLTAYASSTIGNGTQTGGLTVNSLEFIGSGTILGQSLLGMSSSSPSFLQAYITNTDGSSGASADFVVNNNLSTNSSYYGDFGINSSGYSQAGFTGQAANDVFLYSNDSNLDLGTASSTGPNKVNFLIGGQNTANIVAQITTSGASTTALSIGGVNDTPYNHASFTYATSTWTGTTTIPIEVGYGDTWLTLSCFTDAGTLNVDTYFNSTHTNMLAASSTVGVQTYTSNNTMTFGSKVKVDIGTPASSPTKVTCTVKKQENSNL